MANEVFEEIYGEIIAACPACEGIIGASIFGALIALGVTLFLIIIIGLYVYTSWARMSISRKLKHKRPWLAWIPIANIYLMTQIAGVPWWTLFIVIFGGMIPFVGPPVSLGITIWWWWRIAEARNKPGWMSLLLLIPFVNLIIIGVIAWSD